MLALGSVAAAVASHTPGAHFWCSEDAKGECDWAADAAHEAPKPKQPQVGAPPPPPSPVDPSTIKGKTLMGYQGWFGCAGDNVPGYNWWHWTESTGKAPAPGNVQFDVFPDFREYPADAMFGTDLNYTDGSQVKVYSNSMPGVVDLHFSWMHQYSLDGILTQRFLSSVRNKVALQHGLLVHKSIEAASEKYQRTHAVMWDVSGQDESTWADTIKNDWANYVENFTKHSMYLHEGGKPVVSIFGLGLANHKPMPTAQAAIDLINWLKQRAYVIGSGPYYWRVGGHDSLSGYADVHAAFDAIMPWAVGRYGSPSSFDSVFKSVVEGDASKCAGRKQDYAPIAFPGYSFHNTNSAQKLNQIPRLQGQFFQKQLDAYKSLGSSATFYYVAMFDEVNEGTAVYKAAEKASDCPKGVSFVTMDSDGGDLKSDHYLSMVGSFTAEARRNH